MISATGVRISWPDLPLRVRAAIEEILGGQVASVRKQPGGFSPGTADRVVTTRGTRAFIKAASPAQNPDTPTLHRREARITAALPPDAPAPALLGTYDDGTWIALILEDIEGRHPETPWRPETLAVVLRTLAALPQTVRTPAVELPTAAASLGHDFAGWHRVAGNPPPDLDPWAAAHLDLLRSTADRGLRALAGTAVVHSDIRADNLLITPTGEVRIVDWPWACVGPSWLDTVLLLVNVRLYGGHDATALLRECATRFGADEADLIAVLTGVAGYFTDQCRKPAPEGLPTVRGFQRAQSEALLSWLHELLR